MKCFAFITEVVTHMRKVERRAAAFAVAEQASASQREELAATHMQAVAVMARARDGGAAADRDEAGRMNGLTQPSSGATSRQRLGSLCAASASKSVGGLLSHISTD